MEETIYCIFEESSLKNNFLVCKYCQSVIIKPEYGSAPSKICHVLLDKAAHHPDYTQINLSKVTVAKPDGSVVSEETVPLKKQTTSIVNDWWFGPSSPDLRPTTVPSSENSNKNNSSKKQCTQEQIDERMDICNGCEFYKNNTCLKCGCALSREKNYMNKLLWADQSCPINKWRSISS